MCHKFRLGIPLLLAFLALSILFNFSFVTAETPVSAPIHKPVTTAVFNPEPETQPVINPTQSTENNFIPPYDMPVPPRPEKDELVNWQSKRPAEHPLPYLISTAPTARPAVPRQQPSVTPLYSQIDRLEKTVIGQSNIAPTNAPLATNDTYSITLQPIHRNSDGTGLASSFILTNTGGSIGNHDIEFYWGNGDLLYTEVPP